MKATKYQELLARLCQYLPYIKKTVYFSDYIFLFCMIEVITLVMHKSKIIIGRLYFLVRCRMYSPFVV